MNGPAKYINRGNYRCAHGWAGHRRFSCNIDHGISTNDMIRAGAPGWNIHRAAVLPRSWYPTVIFVPWVDTPSPSTTNRVEYSGKIHRYFSRSNIIYINSGRRDVWYRISCFIRAFFFFFYILRAKENLKSNVLWNISRTTIVTTNVQRIILFLFSPGWQIHGDGGGGQWINWSSWRGPLDSSLTHRSIR